MIKRHPSFLLLFLLPNLLTAQTVENRSTLSIAEIMQGDRFVGYLPSGINWSEDSKTIFFQWNPDMDTLRSTYKFDLDADEPMKLSLEERRLKSSFGKYNANRSQKVYSKNGDLFLWDRATGGARQITNTLAREGNPDFDGSGTKIVFTRQNNLFTWDQSTGQITQLTDFRRGTKKTETSPAAHREWLNQDQLEYFNVLEERKNSRETRKRRLEELDPLRPTTYYYGDQQISNLTASPDLQFVTFRLTKTAKSDATRVPNYVTESGYVEDIRARAKVGSPQNTYAMGVYDIAADSVYILNTEQIIGIYDKPEFLREYHNSKEPYTDQYEKAREVIVHGPVYSNDNQAVVVIKSLDNKDRWIMLLELATGQLKLLDRQRDEAWIGGPGIAGWNFSMGNIGWMSDDQAIWFQSEATGYSHLYTIDVKGGEKKALTSGNFEIIDAELSNDQSFFYITANAEGPHDHHFYRLPAAGGTMERITSKEGNHQVTISPDEKYLAIRYSYSNVPWELYLMENKPGAAMQKITKSTTKAFERYSWRKPEIIWFAASDGVKVPARLYKPSKKVRKGPAVIFVHGAGYLQNVHHWWSSYYREFMFHNMLVDNGYTVLDIDYRGSNGYGRDWRTAIYRHMGGKDLSDQIDGVKYLIEQHNIDPNRIGIYGGSYGGFITLMGLFTSPGTFKSGAALRSVTDWAHYNHGYTSNILNTPVEDSLAYYRSSPIYHAENLQDHLLILHGMIDDNVQFQDVVRLAQRLIELGKDNWEFAVFPLERHGFVEPSSWTDEYRRIFKLFQETLK